MADINSKYKSVKNQEEDPKMLIVKKFGGTSVGNRDRIFNVANRCIEDYKKGNAGV